MTEFTCESCEHLSKKDYPAGSGFCLKSKSGYQMYSRKNIQLADFINEVGCASHSKRAMRV